MEICNSNCHHCFYPCLQCKGHETYEDWSSTHSCYQTKLNSSNRHQCSGACDYCDIPRCADDSGHKGKHNCREAIPIHTCGKSCCLSDYPGCMKKCNEDPDHDPNIEHKCNGVHFCKQRCPVQNCPKTCKIKYQHGEEHKEHICNETKCSSKCQVKIWDEDTQTEIECSKDCLCGAHRHILDDMANKKDLNKVHWCGNQHSCPKKCRKPGNCFVGIERSFEETETYTTSSGIKIEYKPFAIAKAGRNTCGKKIAVGKFEHDSGHECAVSKHTCTEKCDSCGYFCMKEYGDNHGLKHETVHGNMRNTIYYAPDLDPDEKMPSPNLLEEQKSKVTNKDEDVSIAAMYRAGDLGKAELCNVFCSRLGRGHIHLELCGKYDHEKGKVRHETRQYKPNANQPKDEIKHSTYWRKKGWADPCTSAKKVNFDKCNFHCTHPSHQETEMKTKETDHTKYCTKELWHEQCATPSGHSFTCDHPFKNAHVVFVCDTSGSMRKTDNEKSIPSYGWIGTDSKLNNRLGALYSAIHDFVDIRWENGRRDTFTAILYPAVTGNVSYEQLRKRELVVPAVRVPASKDFVKQKLLNVKCSDMVFSYQPVLEEAQKHIKLNEDAVVILLTDGDDPAGNAVNILSKLKKSMKERFKFFAITLGPRQNTENKNVNAVCNACQGVSVKAKDAAELCDTFTRIAKQMNTGTFMKKL